MKNPNSNKTQTKIKITINFIKSKSYFVNILFRYWLFKLVISEPSKKNNVV